MANKDSATGAPCSLSSAPGACAELSGAGLMLSSLPVIEAPTLPTTHPMPQSPPRHVYPMQAYGNSGMPRNDDSSRFGKYFKIFFNPNSQAPCLPSHTVVDLCSPPVLLWPGTHWLHDRPLPP